MPAPSTSTNAALLNQALELHRAGRLDEAGAIYEQLLTEGPEHADAAHLLGLVRFRNNDFESAIRLIGDALARDPENPIYHANLGNVLKDSGRLSEAIAAYRRALALRPAYAEVHNNLGYALQASGMIEEAISHIGNAIALRPADYRARFNLGNALFLIGRGEDVIAAFREAATLNPGFASAWDHLGTVLQRLGRHAEAEKSFRRWIEIDSESAEAHLALALALQQQERLTDAFDCCERALDCSPIRFRPWLRRSGSLNGSATGPRPRRTRRPCFAVRRRPAAAALSALLVAGSQPRASIDGGARACGDDHCKGADPSGHRAIRRIPTHTRRISVERLPRPTRAYLTAEVFELHDRERFEVFLFSYGPDDGSAMRQRLAAGGDRFIDIAPLSDREAAKRIHDERIQILVDLKGYTADDRPRIAADRPAPIQVNWLGYPGTMGADWIDYLVADPSIVPPDHDRDIRRESFGCPIAISRTTANARVGRAGSRATRAD